jgi:hypothetical protein
VASSRSTAGNRLGLDDWIQAGYALLAEEGIKALKIDRVVRPPGRHEGQLLLALRRHAQLPRHPHPVVG